MNSFKTKFYINELSEEQLTLCNLIQRGEIKNLQDNSILIKDGKTILLKAYLKQDKKQKLRISNKEDLLKSIKRKYNIEVDIVHNDNDKKSSFNMANLQIQSEFPQINKFYERDYRKLEQQWPQIIQKLKQASYQERKKRKQQLKQFKQQLHVMFYFESLKPVLPDIGQKKIPTYQGIQVSGQILTRDGYKIIYPNAINIMKDQEIEDNDGHPNSVVIRDMRPLQVNNRQYLEDMINDLPYFVWKLKQYKKFFRHLLTLSINNNEIQDILVKIAEKMHTSVNHTFTFYQISSKSWQLPKMIKELNKRNLFQRERQERFDEMMNNIKEDLEELAKPILQEHDEWIPEDECFISFEMYKDCLHKLLRERN